jgi:two-component system chemotaxis response regulator CheB
MVKVLVVDHSPVVRQVLCASLARDLELEVVGSAPDPFVARDLIVQCEPDILTLEIDLPRLDGITFLRRLMVFHPMPAIVVTSAIPGGGLARAALAAGALNVVHKPKTLTALKKLSPQLGELIKAAAQVDMSAFHPDGVCPKGPTATCGPNDPMIAIGSSVGGSNVLESLLSNMPPDSPGIVVAQQMPAELLWEFADRLNRIARIEVRIAKDGDSVCSGVALLSPRSLSR